jgi:cellulose synthase/poly-beta-1,6-N-acetylglucosamine synthase-like glycosyltransferase
MATVATWVFWLSVSFLVYIYGGFALVVAAVGYWRRREVRTAPITPAVSVIIAAYNEEAVIADRLENALALDYPSERLQIIVASDGSTDATDEIVARYASRGVRLLSLPRQGKIRALDAAVPHATGEILVFSDANTMCERNALKALTRNFADARVGGVAGHTAYRLQTGSESSSRGESLYWDYDTWLKQLESLTGSMVSAHGGLYAVRRALYRPCPDSAVTDDFAISTAVIEQGYRLVFEADAHATEFAVPEAQREFGRRVRLMTRGLRGVAVRHRLLNPFRYGFYAVVLFSHKVARRLAPLALLILAWSSAYLASTAPVYLTAAVGQALFYTLAVLGLALRRTSMGHFKLTYVPFFYCMANAACAAAWIQLLRGQRVELWQPQRHAVSSRQA